MPALPRKTQKVFGSSLVPTGNVAVFGSLQAGAPAFSNDPAVIQSLANYLSGFNGAVVGNRSPAMEDFNALFLLVTQQLAYLLQSGIPEWDTNTEYFTGNYVRVAGVTYISLSDNNGGNNPVSDTNNWTTLAKSLRGPTVPVAWVNFNGSTGGILSSFNVAGVVRTAAGCYTISFTEPLADANYAVVATCGPANGGSRSSPAGNNNHVSRDTLTEVGQFSIWIPKPDQLFGEDAGRVSVVVFGN